MWSGKKDNLATNDVPNRTVISGDSKSPSKILGSAVSKLKKFELKRSKSWCNSVSRIRNRRNLLKRSTSLKGICTINRSMIATYKPGLQTIGLDRLDSFIRDLARHCQYDLLDIIQQDKNCPTRSWYILYPMNTFFLNLWIFLLCLYIPCVFAGADFFHLAVEIACLSITL